MRSASSTFAAGKNICVPCRKNRSGASADIRDIDVDVRVVAATNRDLLHMVEEKRFREDLYYRLNVLSIELPPLRERRSDIPVLIDYFLKKHTRGTHRKITITPTPAACSRTIVPRQHPPARIQLFERAILLSENDTVTVEDLPPEMVQRTAPASRRPVQTPARRCQLRGRRTQPDNAGDGPNRQQHHQIGKAARSDLSDVTVSPREIRI